MDQLQSAALVSACGLLVVVPISILNCGSTIIIVGQLLSAVLVSACGSVYQHLEYGIYYNQLLWCVFVIVPISIKNWESTSVNCCGVSTICCYDQKPERPPADTETPQPRPEEPREPGQVFPD